MSRPGFLFSSLFIQVISSRVFSTPESFFVVFFFPHANVCLSSDVPWLTRCVTTAQTASEVGVNLSPSPVALFTPSMKWQGSHTRLMPGRLTPGCSSLTFRVRVVPCASHLSQQLIQAGGSQFLISRQGQRSGTTADKKIAFIRTAYDLQPREKSLMACKLLQLLTVNHTVRFYTKF